MTFEIDTCNFTAPGQYSIIKLKDSDDEGAFTACEYDSNRFTIVYKVTNDITRSLSKLNLGDTVEIQTGLGTGYDIDSIPDGVVLVADESGIPGMLGLLRALVMRGKDCRLVLGYSTKDKIFMIDVFRNLCSNIEILTQDGSNGRQGTADEGIRKVEYVCAAGSIDMLDKLAKKSENGQFNLDGMNVTKW